MDFSRSPVPPGRRDSLKKKQVMPQNSRQHQPHPHRASGTDASWQSHFTESATNSISPATTAQLLVQSATFQYLDYTAGSTLIARVDPDENRAGFGPNVELVIMKPIEPRTMSCGMLVQVREPRLPPRQAFLKVFDRRLSPDFRDLFSGGECQPWSPQVEEEYMKVLREEGMPVGRKHYEEDMTADKWMKMTAVQKEHVFQQRMRKIHHDEREAYRRLEKHQGIHVPTLYASVYLGWHPPDTGDEATNAVYGNLLEMRGLLMEYISGWELLSVPSNLSYRGASRLFEQAVDIIRMIGAHGVLNYDVKLDNFMVTFDPRSGSNRVVMIDLGFCHFRHPAFTAVEWAKLKALAWEGEMNQMCDEARELVKKRFKNDINLDCRSEYGFVVSGKDRRKPPPGWIQVRTSKGPAIVNPQELPCQSSACNPPRNMSEVISKAWRKLMGKKSKNTDAATAPSKAKRRSCPSGKFGCIT